MNPSSRSLTLLPLALALVVSSLDASAQGRRGGNAEPSTSPRVHDPSTPILDGDTWWIFCTGNGVGRLRSRDLVTWQYAPPVFREVPAWHKEAVPENNGHLWAPDVIRLGERYLVYYSISSFGRNGSAIALVSNASLDPEHPDYEWKDEGIVIQSRQGGNFNAIDPHVFRAGDGRLWMSFGSFWSGIQLIELDPETGLRHAENRERKRIAWHEEIEAPAIFERDGMYHLFVNWGKCCRGADSTYEIRVGRSESVTGPYLDADGRDLATGGGTLIIGTEGSRIGPGHASFVTRDGTTTMFIHYYDGTQNGRSVLGHHELDWTEEGWPRIAGADAPEEAAD